MADRYGRYTSSPGRGALPAQPSPVPQAAFTERERMFANIGPSLDPIAKLGRELFEERAKTIAVRGAAEDPQAAINEYRGTPSPDIGQRAAYKLAVEMSAASLQVEATKAISTAAQKAELEQWDLPRLTGELNAIRDGLSEGITNLDPVIGEQLRARIAGAVNTAELRHQGIIAARTSDEMSARALELFDQQLSAIEVHARQRGDYETDYGHDDFAQMSIDQFAETAKRLGASPEWIARQVLELDDAFHVARVREEFDTALAAGTGAAYLEKFAADRKEHQGSARGLDDAHALALAAEMGVTIRGATTSLNSALTEAKRIALEGHLPNGLDQLATQVVASGDPDLLEKYGAITDLLTIQQKFSQLPPSAILDAISVLDAEYSADGYTERESDNIKMLKSIARKNKRGASQNLIEHLATLAKPLDLPSVEPDRFIGPGAEDLFDALSERKKIIGEMSVMWGVDHEVGKHYFSPEENQQWSAFFRNDALSPVDRSTYLTMFASALGDDAGLALTSMDSERGRVWSHLGMMHLWHQSSLYAPDPLAARSAELAFKALDAEGPLIDDDTKKMREVVLREVISGPSGQTPLSETLINSVRETADLMYAALSDEQSGTPTESYEQLVQVALGQIMTGVDNDVSRGGIGEVDGEAAWLPFGMTEEMTEEWYTYLVDPEDRSSYGDELSFRRLYKMTHPSKEFAGFFYRNPATGKRIRAKAGDESPPSSGLVGADMARLKEFWEGTSLRSIPNYPGGFYIIDDLTGEPFRDRNQPEAYGYLVIDMNHLGPYMELLQ